MKFLKWIFLTEKVKEQQNDKTDWNRRSSVSFSWSGHYVQVIFEKLAVHVLLMSWNQLICSWRRTVFLLAERLSATRPPFSVHVPGHSHPAAFHAGEQTDSRQKQRVLNCLQSTRLPRCRMIWLLLPPASSVSKLDRRHTGRLRKRDGRRRRGGEGAKSYDTEEPGPL